MLVRAGTSWATAAAPWAPSGQSCTGKAAAAGTSAVSPALAAALGQQGDWAATLQALQPGRGAVDEPGWNKRGQEQKPHLEVPPCVKMLRAGEPESTRSSGVLLASFVTETPCPC